MSEIIWHRLLEMLAFPPGLTIILLILGFLIRITWLRMTLSFLAVATLYAASIPAVSVPLMKSLEVYPALTNEDMLLINSQAIVVLAGGRTRDAPEYGGDTISSRTLGRLRYGMWLHRHTNQPLLLSGGSIEDGRVPEAVLMERTARGEMGARMVWLEDQSRTTSENARFSSEILLQKGIKKILLVSDAFHMPRAVASFRKTGIQVIPAPTNFTIPGPLDKGWFRFIPRYSSLSATNLGLHELIGRWWYSRTGSI